MRAAVWEYTYVPNGRPTHGLDISFVSPSGSWGYSVLSLVPEDRWRSSEDLIRSFSGHFLRSATGPDPQVCRDMPVAGLSVTLERRAPSSST
jgi:hypothetical protein